MDIKKKISIPALAVTISIGGLTLSIPGCSSKVSSVDSKNHKSSQASCGGDKACGGEHSCGGDASCGAAAGNDMAFLTTPSLPQDLSTSSSEFNTEKYDKITSNPFFNVSEEPVSTFSIDVDTASYSNMRRFVRDNYLPPKDSIRIEEWINYFAYDYSQPQDKPFATAIEIAECPWNKKHWLMHVGIQGKEMPAQELPASNLVFLLDVSGSMTDSNKLPLLKTAMGLLVNRLRSQDRISIVVYAGAAGLVLSPTMGSDKQTIFKALNNLEAGGATNGGEGIELAYRIAEENFVKDGINRVILATDGDFNVGTTSEGDLVRLIEEKRSNDVFLTVLGFGGGNYNDATMEKLADHGNGNYAYIDNLLEARKVLVSEMGGTLVTIAKDVKLQVEFNPQYIASYRLIGYENRLLQTQDFNDDTKDAGEIGAGHNVTALYELVPVGVETAIKAEPLKYQQPAKLSSVANSDELLTLKIRHKQPLSDISELWTTTAHKPILPLATTSNNFRFSAAVAALGMLLRDEKYKGDMSIEQIKQLASDALGEDSYGYRKEFVELLDIINTLQKMREAQK